MTTDPKLDPTEREREIVTDHPSGPQWSPRRAPQPPRIDQADLPDPDELARLRAQLARSSRPSRFIRQ